MCGSEGHIHIVGRIHLQATGRIHIQAASTDMAASVTRAAIAGRASTGRGTAYKNDAW